VLLLAEIQKQKKNLEVPTLWRKKESVIAFYFFVEGNLISFVMLENNEILFLSVPKKIRIIYIPLFEDE
jgi:hypothetical protein